MEPADPKKWEQRMSEQEDEFRMRLGADLWEWICRMVEEEKDALDMP